MTAQPHIKKQPHIKNLPLFYQQPVLLNQVLHKDLVLTQETPDFAFAAKTNSVPVVHAEMGELCGYYPLVFVRMGERFAPVAILGFDDGQNLFVRDDESRWEEGVPVPAYVRRYPYILAETEGDTFNVCFDSAFTALTEDEEGVRLFDAESGEPSDYLNGVLSFLTDYQSLSLQTLTMMDQLAEQQVFVERVLQVQLEDGSQHVLNGFYVIDQETVQACDDAVLADWVRSGLMHLLDAHWISLRQVQALADRYARWYVRQLTDSGGEGQQ